MDTSGSLKSPWVTQRSYLHCRDCDKEISVTAGTIFERTRIPPVQVLSLSCVTTSSPVQLFSQMPGAATTTSRNTVTRTSRRTFPVAEIRLMLSCPASTELRLCSNAGCLAPTRAQPLVSILITNEYTFRFNRRTSRSRGLLFYRLMQQSTASRPISYRQIVNEKSTICSDDLHYPRKLS